LVQWGDAENAVTEYTGVENEGPDVRVRKYRIEKCGTEKCRTTAIMLSMVSHCLLHRSPITMKLRLFQ